MILDIARININSPYKVVATGNANWVRFKTDFGVLYFAGFDKDDTSLLITNTFQFSIINGNSQKSPRDPKVRETIVAIIENFFARNQELMLYICDTGDGKQILRNRLFEYWVNYYKKGWNVVFMSASVPDDGIMNYAGIIVRQDHPRLKDILAEFSQTIALLNSKP